MLVYRGNSGGKLLKSKNGGRLCMCEWKIEELERRRGVRGERRREGGERPNYCFSKRLNVSRFLHFLLVHLIAMFPVSLRVVYTIW